jgi:integrase
MLPQGKGSLPKIPVHEERRALAAKKKLRSIGWHTFRHTNRSWLDETGARAGVQQKFMRHADIRTTMNQYGDSAMPAKRNANSKVVEMVFDRKSPYGAGLSTAETGATGAR